LVPDFLEESEPEEETDDADMEEPFNPEDERKVAQDSIPTYQGRDVSLSKHTKKIKDQWCSDLIDLDSRQLDPIAQSQMVLVMLPPKDLGGSTFRVE
jgi:hypothetical protein